MPLAAAHILLHGKIIHLQKSQFQNASFLHRKVQTSDSSLARECKSLKTQPSRAGDKSSDYHIFSVTLVGVMGKSPLLTSQGHDFPWGKGRGWLRQLSAITLSGCCWSGLLCKAILYFLSLSLPTCTCTQIATATVSLLNINIFNFFNYWFEREKERERGREGDIDLLFHSSMYSLVDSCMCPDREWNPQPWHVGMTLTNWAIWPGQILMSFKFSSQLSLSIPHAMAPRAPPLTYTQNESFS